MSQSRFDMRVAYATKQLGVIRELHKLALFGKSKGMYRGKVESPERLKEAEAYAVKMNKEIIETKHVIDELLADSAMLMAEIATLRSGGVK